MSSSQSQNPQASLYPQVIQSNPDSNSPFLTPPNSNSLYPTIQINSLAQNLFPDTADEATDPKANGSPSFESSEQLIIRIPGAFIHLIDKDRSVELAHGELHIVQLKQGDNVVAALARIGDQIQWPLAKDEAAVKLDTSHYFFTLRVPSDTTDGEITADNILNYGLTIAGKGQEDLPQGIRFRFGAIQ